MTDEEQEALDAIHRAMGGPRGARLEIIPVFFNPDHKEGVQVYERDHRNRWKKVGPLIFPYPGKTTADTLAMLANMRTEAQV